MPPVHRLGLLGMGFSIYPDTKMGEERMVAILERYGTDRMLVNSACDWGKSDPLKVPKTAAADAPQRLLRRGGREGACGTTRSSSSPAAAGSTWTSWPRPAARRRRGALRGQHDPARASGSEAPARGAVHLGYCTNVHPAETWTRSSTQLDRCAGPVRASLGAASWALGLWLSAAGGRGAGGRAGACSAASAWPALGLYVFTLNGFPYGGFHAGRW